MADKSITAANVLKSSAGLPVEGITGVTTITAGMVLYIAADNTLVPADADASAVSKVPVGIALHGSSPGQPIRYCSEDPVFTFGGTANAGTPLFMSDTAGGITDLVPNHATGTDGSASYDNELEAGDTIALVGIVLGTTGQTGVTTMNLKIVIGGVV